MWNEERSARQMQLWDEVEHNFRFQFVFSLVVTEINRVYFFFVLWDAFLIYFSNSRLINNVKFKFKCTTAFTALLYIVKWKIKFSPMSEALIIIPTVCLAAKTTRTHIHTHFFFFLFFNSGLKTLHSKIYIKSEGDK